MPVYRITIVSDENSWMNQYVPTLAELVRQDGHSVSWVHDVRDIAEGDFVFYLGCGQLVESRILTRNRHNLVVHESDLPKGRGWSPMTWQILEGKNEIPISLFEAAESVDSGTIYLKDVMVFKGIELVDDLRRVQAETSIRMCLAFIRGYPEIVDKGMEQKGEPTFYARRTPADSCLDPDKTIRDQFNLLRVVDNERYHAFFEIGGETFIIRIEKKTEEENTSPGDPEW